LRGLIREIMTIVGLIGACAAAYYLGDMAQQPIFDALAKGEAEPEKYFGFLSVGLVADIAAYGGVFIVTLIVLGIAGYFLAQAVEEIGMGAVDRSLGVVFGLARGLLLLGLLYLPYQLMTADDAESRPEWLTTAKTYPAISKTADILVKLKPDSDVIDEKIDEAKKKAEDAADKASDIKDAAETLEKLTTGKPKADKEDGAGQPGYDNGERDSMQKLIEGTQ